MQRLTVLPWRCVSLSMLALIFSCARRHQASVRRPVFLDVPHPLPRTQAAVRSDSEAGSARQGGDRSQGSLAAYDKCRVHVVRG